MHNYKIADKNCFRKDVIIHINLTENNLLQEFYEVIFNVSFDIIGLENNDKFIIYYTADKEEYENFGNSLTGTERVLFFPFLMAKGIEKIADPFRIFYFKMNGCDVLPQIESTRYIFTLKNLLHNTAHVSFQFSTFLNKAENYVFEEISCVCEGYHLDFNYANTNIRHCNFYCSNKDTGLSVEHLNKIIYLNMSEVILPGKLFIFIWSYNGESESEQNKLSKI